MTTGLTFLWRIATRALVLLSLVVVGLSFTPMAQTTNCGGNSSALQRVSMLHHFAQSVCLDRADGTCNFSRLTIEEIRQLASLGNSGWNKDATFYVTSGDLTYPMSPRKIIAVCGTPYRNVPERALGIWKWPAPPGHAVAYADGTTGLIPPAEYASLERGALMDVASIAPPGSDAQPAGRQP